MVEYTVVNLHAFSRQWVSLINMLTTLVACCKYLFENSVSLKIMMCWSSGSQDMADSLDKMYNQSATDTLRYWMMTRSHRSNHRGWGVQKYTPFHLVCFKNLNCRNDMTEKFNSFHIVTFQQREILLNWYQNIA